MIEDDLELAEILTEYLEQFEFEVITEDDPFKAVSILKLEKFDLVILDLTLPGMDGLEVCESIRERQDIPIIISSARSDVTDKIKALELGADDYLIKPFAFAEVLARVRTLIRRGAVQTVDDILIVADLEMDIPKRKIQRAGKRILLSNKEFSLLELLLRREGEVLPRSLIASQVWDMNFDSDTNVIDVAIRRLRAKVDDDFTIKLIHTVRGMGYKLEVETDGY